MSSERENGAIYSFIRVTGSYCLVLYAVLSWPILYDPTDYSLPGSSVHGTLQARILEWFSIVYSRRSSLLRDRTRVSCISRQILGKPPGKPSLSYEISLYTQM